MSEHKEILLEAYGRSAYVDEGIADDIELLWANGIDTDYSCQGNIESNVEGYMGRFIIVSDKEKAWKAQKLLPWVKVVSFWLDFNNAHLTSTYRRNGSTLGKC